MRRVSRVMLKLAIVVPIFLAMIQASWAAPYYYILGSKIYINQLYPTVASTAVSPPAPASCKTSPMTITDSIQCYLEESLQRDNIGYSFIRVFEWSDNYVVSLQSDDPRVGGYGAVQTAWLKIANQALNGVKACQKDPNCWQKAGSTPPPKCKESSSEPWTFYLPFGLPMMAQKMVMLLHYPPYSSMPQYDYLANATMARWQRMLTSVGVAQKDLPLYQTILDIFPVAAPGSNQSQCITAALAAQYFGSPTYNYITPMLSFLSDPASNGSKTSTLPVVIFSGEDITYWNNTYPNAKTGVLKPGRVKLSSGASKTTPFMGANHPIAAVYQTCTSTPGIVTMEHQDLTTACFAKKMAENPDADPVAVEAACAAQYSGDASPEAKELICINAKIDMSPYSKPWTWQQAKDWCAANNNNPCASE